MGEKETGVLITLAIIFIGYFIVKKLYTFWIKVGYHVIQGVCRVYKAKKESETIFSIIKEWYYNRSVFCRTCNASGIISECCNSQTNNIRVEEKEDGYHLIKRRTQCVECGALCTTINCYCRK